VILRLVREQLRSIWRYTAWMIGLTSLAVALATFAMSSAATSVAFYADNPELAGGANTLVYYSYAGDRTNEVPPLEGDPSYFLTMMSLTDVSALLDDARAAGPVEASRYWTAELAGTSNGAIVEARLDGAAWEPYLLSGEPAGPGEVVVRWDVAQELGVGPGDTVTLAPSTNAPTKAGSIRLRVSGINPTGLFMPWFPSDYQTQIPEFAANWDDTLALDEALAWRAPDWPHPTVTTVVEWRGDNSVLTPLVPPDMRWTPRPGFRLGEDVFFHDALTTGTFSLSTLLALAVALAAIPIGRAQAGARARWIATARTLGARKATVVEASILEAAAAGLASGAAGMGVGLGASAILLAGIHVANPHTVLPATISVPAVIVLAGMLGALALAALIAATPAFWATRVEPVAALKPSTPLTARSASRKVGAWWPAAIAGGATAVLVGVHVFAPHASTVLGAVLGLLRLVAQLAVAVSLCAIAVQVARTVVLACGRALRRSRRPWAIVAGEDLTVNTQLFTFAALTALVFGGFVGGAMTLSAEIGGRWGYYLGWAFPIRAALYRLWPYVDDPNITAPNPALVIFTVITIVAVVVTTSARNVTGLDAATELALGLRARHARIAAAARQFVPTAAGLLLGALIGVAVVLTIHDVAGLIEPDGATSFVWNLDVLRAAAPDIAKALGYSLAIALAGAAVVGLLTRTKTPVEAMKRHAEVTS
jgi:hypothetical protein